LADGDPALITAALSDIAHAKGMMQIAPNGYSRNPAHPQPDRFYSGS
jgi:DNA-binding phage protein